MGLSSGFTQPDARPAPPPPPLIGALLRVPWETVRERMLTGLHDRGFTDLVAAHVDVWRYPGPENQRPSELATQTHMTKQALNYLLGQLEQLGYLTRETNSNDQRSKRIRLTPKAMLQAQRSTKSSRASKPNGNNSSAPESSGNYAGY